MARQRATSDQDGLEVYELPGPMGGVNTKGYSTKLRQDKFEMLTNLEFATKVGAFVGRKGYTAYNSSTIDSNPIRGGVRWYYGSSSKQMIVGSGTKLYKDNSGSFTQIGSGYTTGKEWFFASYFDVLYAANGADAIQRWDGTTMRAAGYTAPVTACNVALGASGGLTGAYKYKVTFVYDSNSAHESSAGPASATINPSSQKVSLTNIPTGGTGCTARNIYRTKAGGSDYYLLTTINDNATTTYTDTQQAATGTITTVAGANLVDGETFTVSDGVHEPVVFEFDSNSSVTAGHTAVTFAGGDTANQVRDAIVTAVTGKANFDVSAASGGASTVALTNDTTGAFGNVAMSETVANGSFAVSGMSGGQNGSDSALSTLQAPTDNGIPPSGAQFVLVVRGRAAYARTSTYPARIFLSSITSTEKSPDGTTTIHGADAEIFPSTHWVDIGDNNSPITGLSVLNDEIVIFKEDGVYLLLGDKASDMRVFNLNVSSGCIAPRTIVNVGNYIYYLGRCFGSPTVYKFDGAQSQVVSAEIEPTLLTNIKSLGDVASQAIQPSAAYYRGQYIMSYAKAGGSLYEVAAMSDGNQGVRWNFWDSMKPSVFIPWNGRGDAGELYFGSAEEGRVLRADNGLTDYKTGTPAVVTSVIQTRWMDLGMPNRYKQIRHIEIRGKANSKGRLTVERRLDWNTSGTTSSVLNMSTVIASHGIFKTRIDCAGGDQTTPENCYLLQLVLTFYASDTSPSDTIEIDEVLVYFSENQPPLMIHDGQSGTAND